MANNSNSWKGFPYPIVKTSGGFFKSKSGAAQIKSDLLILLLTYPGERVMLPEFGTPLQDLIFEPGDTTLINQARQMIIKAINRWEPRVRIDTIEVKINPPSSHLNKDDNLDEKFAILNIRILFNDPDVLTQLQELVLDVPLPS